MKYTAGAFIFDKNDNMLIVHATNSPWNQWSIPKGVVDKGESRIEACLRELKEETNLKLRAKDIIYRVELPEVRYINGKKTLCPFFIRISKSLKKHKLKCNSYVSVKGRSFPEVDQFNVCDIDEGGLFLHHTQIETLNYIKEHDLLELSKNRIVHGVY